MFEVPKEINILAEIERHIQWCEIDKNLSSLTPAKYTVGPGEEIPTVPSINSYQAGKDWNRIVNQRLTTWGKELPSPEKIEKQDTFYFSLYISEGLLVAEDHRALFYEEWRLIEQCVITSLEYPEKYTGFYSEWIKELHQRYENSLVKAFPS